ncbi:hypothetical protein B0A49_01805 [Cryomyces minteri]|uniref:ZNF598/HEL2 PAH domain-containing protein n=1 Tax=Cryomyces minteri TaxID=331657 RepID=A0A4V5NH31_9PEZI|nr:hypothetical protein B0A49_01805 [Cryomyces minteri]
MGEGEGLEEEDEAEEIATEAIASSTERQRAQEEVLLPQYRHRLLRIEAPSVLTEAQTVIFTDDATKRFEDYRPEDFASSDEGLGIKYEKIEIFEDTVLLLRYNCPDPSCDVACLGWPDLHRHVKSVHHKVMCDLCTRNKKVFTHEHELFTINELRKHEKYGDDNPGAVDQSGFKAPRQAVQTHDAFPSISSLNLGSSAAPSPRPSSPTQPLTPQEQARRLRHAAVIDRAAALLRNDATKLSTFRIHISSYRLGTISAPDLIDAFFALFDNAPVTDLGKLIKELAEIFEIETKRDALLKAWADWKAIHEDYPSLPGPGGAGRGAMTAARVLGGAGGGSRVLKLKSSTAQSSRSAVGRQGSWGSASPLSGSGHPFPPMPAASSANRTGPGKVSTVPWVASPSSTITSASSASVSSRPASSTHPAPTRTAAGARDAFPALPAAKKPTSTVFSPGYNGAGVRRVEARPLANPSPWGSASASATASATPSAQQSDAEEADGAAAKRKGKGKKQMLFQWG